MSLNASLLARPGVPILLRSLASASLAWGALAGLAWAVAGVEEGDVSVLALLTTLGPLAWAVGVALGIAGAVQRGEWAGWTALGVSSRRLSAGIVVFGVVCGLASLGSGGGQAPVAGMALPAPVSEDARWWPTADGWNRAQLDRWTSPPGDLALPDLIARFAEDAPAGSQSGVDAAELIRRGVFALAWPLAGLFGVRWGRRVPLRGGAASGAAGLSAGAVGMWLLLGALVSAYASTMT